MMAPAVEPGLSQAAVGLALGARRLPQRVPGSSQMHGPCLEHPGLRVRVPGSESAQLEAEGRGDGPGAVTVTRTGHVVPGIACVFEQRRGSRNRQGPGFRVGPSHDSSSLVTGEALRLSSSLQPGRQNSQKIILFRGQKIWQWLGQERDSPPEVY